MSSTPRITTEALAKEWAQGKFSAAEIGTVYTSNCHTVTSCLDGSTFGMMSWPANNGASPISPYANASTSNPPLLVPYRKSRYASHALRDAQERK